MHKSVVSAVIVSLLLITVSGCLPRTFVRKNPTDADKGIRYYRPKPYLMIKPAMNNSGEPVAGYVSIETTTLPDFSEEYSIHVRSGLGINNTDIKLEDGWKLTGLNVQIDSQFDENVKAAAEVMKAVPTSSGFSETRTLVRSTNVPFGLYEAVIGKYNCKKRLYGFRYVGFLPYSNCPVEFSGCESQSCESANLYGLVFDKEAGVMVFKELQRIAYENVNPERVVAPTASDGVQDLADPVNDDVNAVIQDADPR